MRWLSVIALLLLAGLVVSLRGAKPQPELVVAQPSPQAVALNCATLKSAHLMVVLILGQSNAANHGLSPASAGAKAFSFFQGHCYVAQDPLPGATGEGGSVWTRLAPQLIQAGIADQVLFVPLAVESTTVAAWNQDARLRSHLLSTLQELQTQGLPVTHIFWHQGEADAKAATPGARYQNDFRQLVAFLREQGLSAPIYVAQASICRNQANVEIRAAQHAVLNPALGILPGPDTDVLDGTYRYDGCHFSDAGLARAATLWLAALQGHS